MFSSPRLPHRSLYSFSFALLTALILSACAAGRPPYPAELTPFTSDGCTLFPDGTPNDQNKWCDCCQAHDLAYWQGGSADERSQADLTLRNCVRQRTNDQALAETIYLGVRTGGHPAFPTWYRWGYGWPYGRGYRSLSNPEKFQVQEQIAAYRQQHPAGYCREGVNLP
jgi:hypothetical protein